MLQLLFLGLLLYLIVDTFIYIDFAASKNDAFTAWQKAEFDRIQNMDTVK